MRAYARLVGEMDIFEADIFPMEHLLQNVDIFDDLPLVGITRVDDLLRERVGGEDQIELMRILTAERFDNPRDDRPVVGFVFVETGVDMHLRGEIGLFEGIVKILQ